MNRIPLKVSQWSRVVQLAQNAQSQSQGGWHPSRAVISFLPPSQNYPVWFPNLPPEGVLAGISLFPEIKSFGMFAPSRGGTCGSSLPDASPCSHSTTFPLSLQVEKEDNNNIKILIPLGWQIWDGEEGFYLVFTGREGRETPSSLPLYRTRMGAVLWAQEGNCLPCSNPWKTFNKHLHQLWGLVQSWQIGVEQILFGCKAAIPGKMDPREVGGPAELFNTFLAGGDSSEEVPLEKCPPPYGRTGWDPIGMLEGV